MDNCVSTCNDPCPETFREVESYHRLCDHDDISEAFDEAFDQNPWADTVCAADVAHCNVAGEEDHVLNCSAPINAEALAWRLKYGNLTEEVYDDHDHGDSSAYHGILATIIVSLSSFLAVIF